MAVLILYNRVIKRTTMTKKKTAPAKKASGKKTARKAAPKKTAVKKA